MEVLKQNLIDLCKSDTVHYEVTANLIRDTRLTLIANEGMKLPAIEDEAYLARIKEIDKLDKEIAFKQQQYEDTCILLHRLETKIESTKSVLEKVKTVRKKKADTTIGQ